jgi:phospholipase C
VVSVLRIYTNPKHTRPGSIAEIGHAGPANHGYDLDDFYSAVRAGNFPSRKLYQGPGVPGWPCRITPIRSTSRPSYLSEPHQFSATATHVEKHRAIVMYDDSDGWYDHQSGPIVNTSSGSADFLTGAGTCGNPATALPGVEPKNTHAFGRCGYGFCGALGAIG